MTRLDNGCFVFNPNGTLYQKGEGDVANIEFWDNTTEPNLLIFISHKDQPRTSIMELAHHNHMSGLYNLLLQKEITRRQPAPYISNCTWDGLHTDNTLPNRYTRSNCLASCMVRRIFDKCGDVMDHLSHFITDEMKAKVNKKSESETRECLNEVWIERMDHDLPPVGCNCPYACHDIIYKYQFEKWQDVQDNYWNMYIRFSERSIRYVTQEPLHTIPGTLSNLGGFMGLLAGLSVLSLAEILLFIVVCLVKFTKDCFK